MDNDRTIRVSTKNRDQLCDITSQVARLLPAGFNGVCMVFCLHTTAGLTINENADPDVARDILEHLRQLAPWNSSQYRHGEGNSAAHIKASLMGFSVSVPVSNGKLVLGTWQSVYFAEFDGPRDRRVTVRLLADVAEGGQ